MTDLDQLKADLLVAIDASAGLDALDAVRVHALGKQGAITGLLKTLGGFLGLLQGDPKAFLQAGAGLGESEIATQIELRAAAKSAKNFAEADRIRQALAAQGVVLKDSPTGTTWERG